MDELDADEDAGRRAGKIAVILVDQGDEAPLVMADRVLAELRLQRLPVLRRPFAAAHRGVPHALEVFIRRDDARVAESGFVLAVLCHGGPFTLHNVLQIA